jgi:hypothetical protein
MAEKILGPAGSKRRKRFLWVPALLIACTALFVIGNAQAVHDLQFQLDGNADTSCGTPSNCNTSGTGAGQIYDWSSLFTTNTQGTPVAVNGSVVKASNTVGFTNATFTRDFKTKQSAHGAASTCDVKDTGLFFCNSDDSTFATGSKDILPISPVAGVSGDWQCNQDNNVNSKIDIMNSYAAAYTAPNGDKILYFGLDKNKDNGNNDVGFWFLQGDAGCTSPPTSDFTGVHHDGDILITSAFTSGGGVSNIEVFKWAGGANGCLDNPADVKTCDQEPFGSGGDCKTTQTSTTTAPADAICATTNSGTLPTNGNILVPWETADATLGVGHTVVPPDFFEGGIDLTLAFAQAGSTAPSCFNTFIADTRSSQEPTATLFDFTQGTLGECHTTVTTQFGGTGTGQSAPAATIGTGVASSGTDTANVQVLGSSNFNGTLTFYLCGPDDALTTCSTTTGALITTVNNVNANGNYNSGTASLTKAGHYCWHAHFQPDATSAAAGIGPGDDDGTSECFTVAKVTPTIQTCSGTWDLSGLTPVCTAAGTVNFGSSVSDTALVSGLAKEPGSLGPSTTYPTINPTVAGAYGGSIEFKLMGPAASGCGSLATGTPSGGADQTTNINTSTGNGTYSPANAFTPNQAGLYHWQATLSNSASVNNILPVSDDANCDDADEAVTIRTIPTDIRTRQSWFPNDTAVIASSVSGDNILAGGTVDFFLYPSADCTGTASYTERHTLVAGDISSGVATVGTVNYPNGGGTAVPSNPTWAVFRITTALTDAAGTSVNYSWKVVYTPAAADTVHQARQAGCIPAATGNGVAGDAASIEKFNLTYTNDNSGGKKP